MAVTTEKRVFSFKTRAIVCFGHASDVTGWKPGDFFQVVIDPSMQSPAGDYIRFDQRDPAAENEIQGWQKIDALTVCEVLDTMEPCGGESVTMRAIVKE